MGVFEQDVTAARMMLTAALGGAMFLASVPVAAALGWGSDATGVNELTAAGAKPTYGQLWVGEWMSRSGWGGYESQLRDLKAAGVTPVVMWYYWGDGISPNTVAYGSGSHNKAEWESLRSEMTRRAGAIMGSSTIVFVLEPEFNKNGISSWETFDGYLAEHASKIRAGAPGAKIVVGFGSWGGWDIFDRAVAASDMTGFQELRGSTRDSVASAEGVADHMISVAKGLKSRFGKDVFVFDLGISTYGGWEGVQERALRNVDAKEADIEAAGVKAIVWRYVRDNTLSSGYFGPAEYTWGVKRTDGSAKPGYDELLALLKGGSAAPAPAPAPSPSPSPSSPFTNVKGNEWWIEATSTRSASSVAARVDGGAWVALALRSWGAWAVSTHAPSGSIVELRASYSDGTSASARYAWPQATPVAPAPAPASFTATWSGVSGNSWWVQADVAGSEPVVRVDARVDGGAWTPLTKQSWGSWAKSFFVASGSKVQLRATSTSGATALSGEYVWPR